MKKIISFVIIILCCYVTVAAQEQAKRTLEVGGVVYDAATNEPLIGVSVSIKNAPGVGVMTNINGEFKIKVAPRESLLFQMIGMESAEYFVEKSDFNLKIVMKESSKQLQEVVVTGLTSQKKVSIAGAISTINVSDLKTPATSINNMMGGRIAGVITSMTSGEPGQNISNFWVRGIQTFGANAGALVLIDGLEGRLQDIDPDDIQSFSILKDAAATAVYGVRGANGVVVITTKRGYSGKLKISARATLQVNQIKRLPQYLGAYDYAKLANEARALSGEADLYTPLQLDVIKSGLDPDIYPDVNWMSEIMKKTSMKQRYFINAQGGGDVAQYYVSIGGQVEGAAYKQADMAFKKPVSYNTVNYRANIDMKLTPTTNLYFGTEGNINNYTRPGSENTNSLWRAVRMLTPVMFPVTYSDGTLPTYGTQDLSSPYASLNYTGYSFSNDNRNMLTLELKQEFKGVLQGLRLSAQVQSDLQTYITEFRRVSPNMYRATGRDAEGNLIKSLRLKEKNLLYGKGSNHWRKYYFQSKAEWNRSYGNHDLGALLFYYMEDVQDGRWTFDDIGLNSIPARRQNLSGRVSYGYNNIYFVDANFGYTGSSQFKKGERYGFFPSIALAWVPTGYDWFQQSVPWISFLKFRGSYGLAGNDQISNSRFPYLTLISNSAGTAWGYRSYGITELRVGADNLKWEVARKANVGLELNMFKDKLKIVVDAFRDQRDNIFMQRVTLPNYLGLVTVPYSNVGRMHSFGSDGNIEYHHVISKDMGFTVRSNYTFAQNIIDYFEENKLPYDYLSVTGKPHGVLRGYISEGLFKSDDEIKNSPDQSVFGRVRAGDIKYRDVNGDGRINEDDKVPLSYGNQVPRFVGGLGGDFRWKSLNIGILFKGAAKVDYFRSGATYYADGAAWANAPGWIPFYNGDLGNVIALANNPKNRWTPAWYSGDPATENPNAEFPRLSYGNNTNNEQLSTFWKRDGSYIRLQEVSVKYKLKDHKWLNVAGLSSIDMEFVVNNIFTIDKVKYFDPEQASYNGAVYPIPTSYTLQLYLNF